MAKMVQTVQNCPEWSKQTRMAKMVQNGPDSRTVQYDPNCPYGPNGQELSTMVQMVQNGPNGPQWSTMVHNGPQWSTMVQLVQDVPYGPKCSWSVENGPEESKMDQMV